ncbi:unnamed protein product [Prunus armeniaca]
MNFARRISIFVAQSRISFLKIEIFSFFPNFSNGTLKPPSLSAVTSAPNPPQIRPCRRHRRTQELLRRGRQSCRRELLRLGRISAAVVLSPPGTKSGN